MIVWRVFRIFRFVIKQRLTSVAVMLKRCNDVSEEDSQAVKRKKMDEASDASSNEDDEDDDSSWVPSSGEDDSGEVCGMSSSVYGTRSRGVVAFPSDMDDLNDHADNDADKQSDLSSDSDDEEEDDVESSDDEDEESETEDDEYSDDDSFVTSDEEEHCGECADCPVALTRCEAGIPDLVDDVVTSNKEDAT